MNRKCSPSPTLADYSQCQVLTINNVDTLVNDLGIHCLIGIRTQACPYGLPPFRHYLAGAGLGIRSVTATIFFIFIFQYSNWFPVKDYPVF